MVEADNAEALKRTNQSTLEVQLSKKKMNSFDKHARNEFRHDFNVGHFANTTQEVEQTIELKPNL